MQLDHYETEANDILTVFRFISEGRQGRITKLVQLSPIDLPAQRIDPGPTARGAVCNLAFGDYKAGSSQPDDRAVSDNGDPDKVLATVAGIAYEFCHRYSWCWVFAKGSTPARTRLYQMGLNRFHADVVGEFELFGYLEPLRKWVIFEKNTNYAAFLIRLKQLK